MKHTIFTIATIVALILASLLGMLLSLNLFLNIGKINGLNNVFLFLFPVVSIFNLIVAFTIFKLNFRYVKLAFWIYAVQIVGIHIQSWALSFVLGFGYHISFNLGFANITLNLFALVMALLLFKVTRYADKNLLAS